MLNHSFSFTRIYVSRNAILKTPKKLFILCSLEIMIWCHWDSDIFGHNWRAMGQATRIVPWPASQESIRHDTLDKWQSQGGRIMSLSLYLSLGLSPSPTSRSQSYSSTKNAKRQLLWGFPQMQGYFEASRISVSGVGHSVPGRCLMYGHQPAW